MKKIKKIISLLFVAIVIFSATSAATQAFAAGSYAVPAELAAELQDIYKQYDFTVAWGLYDLSGSSLKEVASFNADKTFQSNCTIKAAMLLYVCKLMDEGKLTKNTKISVDASKMHYDGLTSGDYTVDYLLTKMIKVSNSVCFEVLHRYVTREAFNAFLASIGSKTKMSSYTFMGTCKPQDRATEWWAIYNYCHSDAKNAAYAWRQFKTALYSPIRDGFFARRVAHKGGWYYKEGVRGSAGDCAVVKTKNGGCYLVVIFTQNNKVGDYSTELIGSIARTLDKVWNSYYKSLEHKGNARF